jgi:hypothetical protein
VKHILKFIFSSIFFLAIQANAQKEVVITDSLLVAKDTIAPKIERYGIRFGVDLFKLTRSFYEKDYRGIELVGDFRISKKRYIAVELGNENKTVDDDRINFTTNGSYIKVGADYNAYENWTGMHNLVYLGLRYGISSFSQERNSFLIYNPNTYFGENIEITETEKFNGLSAQWLELVVGVKAEVFTNVFVGFSARLNRIVSQTSPENFENLYIPGYNRTYNGEFGVGFNYTVSYFLPLYKTVTKPKEVAVKKK